MSNAKSFVVSDLHLGNHYFFCDSFLSWLDGVPEGAGLILNGDILDKPERPLDDEHHAVLQRLIDESHRRSVIWVYGNHDYAVKLDDPGKIQFVRQWEIDRRLLVFHGHEIDNVMPRHSVFKLAFKVLHRTSILLGLKDVHVAKYAKKWGFLYRVLNEHVARRALYQARDLGFEAVTCGHTHAVMELERDGTRYLNTGAWTEEPHYYLSVGPETIDLLSYQNGTAQSDR